MKLRWPRATKQSAADKELAQALKPILGFTPQQIELYRKAFTHSSAQKKDELGHPFSYERLEFLGDSILGTIIAKYLYDSVPGGDEGYLTKMRSKIVSREHLNELGKELKLIQFVDSKVQEQHFGDNIFGNLFEALVGAVYLDQGYVTWSQFIYRKIIDPHVNLDQLEGKVASYKSLMIEWFQKEKKRFDYQISVDSGNEAQKHFCVKLVVDGVVTGKGRATSKKKAEEIASKRAYFSLQDKIQRKEHPSVKNTTKPK
jgi:ribonuclease-3